MAENIYEFDYDFLIPPGETLLETIEELDITQAELAIRTGRPTKTINGIIKGNIAITPETALQFEKVLGVPAHFWNNLEKDYREQLSKKKEMEILSTQTHWIEKFPLKEMIKRKWITPSKGEAEQLEEMLKFFGVASVSSWGGIWETDVAFRKSPTFTSNPGSVAAWLRQGELEAKKIECKPFDKDIFKENIMKIRELTNNDDQPEVFIPKMQELCAEAGVALVFLPELPKCHISGATKWISSSKALIILSARYRVNDHLWFTFFHEAGHILLHGKKKTFIEEKGNIDEFENEANEFAANTLIPDNLYKRFIQNRPLSKVKVREFAKEIAIAPGIVVGRLQKDGLIPYSYLNQLKQRYIWTED